MGKFQKSISLLALVVFPGLCAGSVISAHGEGPEDYLIEITASLWQANTHGTITDDSSPINFISDLGVGQRKYTFDGQLTFKPWRKHRFVLEGRPISIHGLNTITRTVNYFDQSFSVSDLLKSAAQMDYVYFGYHHDWMSGSMGRFGTSIGAAYLGLSGHIQGIQSGIDKQASTPFGVPLAGMDFRVFPIPGHKLIEAEGGVRGISAGSYGYWVEGSISGGFRYGPVGILAGYREMLVDFHQNSGANNGINLRLRGPMVTALFSW